MNHITVREGSDYFRGLLLLIRKDRKISEPEIILMKRIGKALGFEKDFCDNAIQEILENKHVSIEPPKFSTNDLAMKFIKDGLMLADSDNEIHAFEEAWLKTTAENNGIDVEWFIREKEIAAGKRRDLDDHLAMDDLTIEHSRRDP
ncbi:MAG: hypothetical protein ACKVRP_08825 [Bacteroidota bacterium]